jgi:hypothetical protein
MNKTTFNEAICYLTAAYKVEMQEDTMRVYWEQLGALADDTFRTTVRVIVATDTFFPTVARVLDIYRGEARRAALKARESRAGPPLRAPERDKQVAQAALANIRELLRTKGTVVEHAK